MKIDALCFLVIATIVYVVNINSVIAAYQYAPVTDDMRQTATKIINFALSPQITQDNILSGFASTNQNNNNNNNNTFQMMSTYNLLAQLCDNFGARLSGSDDLELALGWIVATAQNDDLTKYFPATAIPYTVSTETVMVPHWVRGDEWATVYSPFRPNSNQSIKMVGLGMSNGTNGKVLTAPLFVVSSYADLQSKKDQAKGKIVLFNYLTWTSYGHDVAYRSNAAQWCQAVGCVAALIRSVASYGMQTPHTGYSVTASVPSAAISLADTNQLTRQFQRGVPLTISLYMEATQLPDRASRNIIFDIPGKTKPSEIGVVFGGHVDGWSTQGNNKYTGGDHNVMDDGGGIVGAWNAIRTLAALGIRADRTMRAVMWVNEENGNRGGEAYARDHAAELNVTSIAIESDEGPFSPWSLGFSGGDAAFNQLVMLAELVAPLGSGNVTRGGGGEDISPMCDQGVPCAGVLTRDPRATNFSNNPCRDMQGAADFNNPALGSKQGISDGYFWYHHSSADTMETVDPTQLQILTANFAVWAYAISSLPELLPRGNVVAPPTPAPPPMNNNNNNGENGNNNDAETHQAFLRGLFIGIVVGLILMLCVALIAWKCFLDPSLPSNNHQNRGSTNYRNVNADHELEGDYLKN